MTEHLKKISEKENLRQRMRHMKVFEKDIEETFVLSSGPGGQNVNKVATCVCLYHPPSGMRVKCQEHRVQAMNRHSARVLLLEKIDARDRSQAFQKRALLEKKKRQTRPRPKALKEKILRHKKQQAEKKSTRRKVREGEY